MYEICFLSRVPPNIRGQPHTVYLNVKHGVEAKNYEGLGDANKLKPLEVELKRLEDLSLSIVQDFAYMRQREEEMRDTNESTNSRVLYFSIFSMCCLLGNYELFDTQTNDFGHNNHISDRTLTFYI